MRAAWCGHILGFRVRGECGFSLGFRVTIGTRSRSIRQYGMHVIKEIGEVVPVGVMLVGVLLLFRGGCTTQCTSATRDYYLPGRVSAPPTPAPSPTRTA